MRIPKIVSSWLIIFSLALTIFGVSGATVAYGSATPKCVYKSGLPDSRCTPGAVSLAVTQANIKKTICKSGYTKTVRPSTTVTSKIKAERMKAYGATGSPSKYELDHLIPLELGGATASVKNLFPEPYAGTYGATTKDKLENKLNALVCTGKLKLKDAQKAIATNWISAYKKYVTTKTPTTNTNTNTGLVIKKSTTGICHAPGTTYYDRTTNFTPYKTLQACLDSGGRLPLN